MDNKSIADQLGDVVIREIQGCYSRGELSESGDCINDMLRDGLYEADVEMVIMNADTIDKVMAAKSPRASNPRNTHYVIPGVSTKGRPVYCKICSNYHPETNEFIEWRLTSFCNK